MTAARLACGLAVAALCLAAGCSPESTGELDTRLRVHASEDPLSTPEGLSYAQALARAHGDADAAAERAKKVEILEAALGRSLPREGGALEVLRLELASRLCETLLEDPAQAAKARGILQPMLSAEHSLPLDRASARALVVLGDAARADGDDALAAGSYARAMRMMSMLREELEQ